MKPRNANELMRMTAVFGDGGRYRYSLTREWDMGLDQVCWIMLNPSKASADRDDPTIRRCIGYARRWGFGGIVVVNLFGLVATYPKDLIQARDPIGPHNDEAIRQAISNRQVIVAWGNQPDALPWPANNPTRIVPNRVAEVLQILECTKTPAKCLGLTAGGHPSHPVRLAWKAKRRRFTPSLKGEPR